MTQDDLREFVHRQPFEPFRVVLTTGETHDIRHPDLIMVGRRSVIIGITRDPTERLMTERSKWTSSTW